MGEQYLTHNLKSYMHNCTHLEQNSGEKLQTKVVEESEAYFMFMHFYHKSFGFHGNYIKRDFLLCQHIT